MTDDYSCRGWRDQWTQDELANSLIAANDAKVVVLTNSLDIVPTTADRVIRTVFAALLYELSLVTRPAYEDSEVEADDETESRNWNPAPPAGMILPSRHLRRWRA